MLDNRSEICCATFKERGDDTRRQKGFAIHNGRLAQPPS